LLQNVARAARSAKTALADPAKGRDMQMSRFRLRFVALFVSGSSSPTLGDRVTGKASSRGPRKDGPSPQPSPPSTGERE
jgi:hypothetical protein